jgi:hypothetical protein
MNYLIMDCLEGEGIHLHKRNIKNLFWITIMLKIVIKVSLKIKIKIMYVIKVKYLIYYYVVPLKLKK